MKPMSTFKEVLEGFLYLIVFLAALPHFIKLPKFREPMGSSTSGVIKYFLR